MRRSPSPRPASTPSAPPNASSIDEQPGWLDDEIADLDPVDVDHRCSPWRRSRRAAARCARSQETTPSRSAACSGDGRAARAGVEHEPQRALAVDVNGRPHAADPVAQRRRDVARLRAATTISSPGVAGSVGGGTCAEALAQSAQDGEPGGSAREHALAAYPWPRNDADELSPGRDRRLLCPLHKKGCARMSAPPISSQSRLSLSSLSSPTPRSDRIAPAQKFLPNVTYHPPDVLAVLRPCSDRTASGRTCSGSTSSLTLVPPTSHIPLVIRAVPLQAYIDEARSRPEHDAAEAKRRADFGLPVHVRRAASASNRPRNRSRTTH